MTMSEIVIKLENLSKLYNLGELHHQTNSFRDKIASFFKKDGRSKKVESIWALKDVSFEVKKGEILGIIGRNGAGKSTLLKILSRITKPTRGKVLIDGNISSLLEVGTGFHPELTGRENIYLNGSILGMKKEEISRKFDEIVAFAEIEKFLDTPVKHYSSGMYVRLAFAVAAHMEPDILLVDEVLAVGDIAFQKKCLGKMQDIGKEGRTILFISHQMRAIRSLCQSAIWLNKGQLFQRGSSQDIVRAYENIHLEQSIKPLSIITRHGENTNECDFFVRRVAMVNINAEYTTTFRYKDSLILNLDFWGKPKSSHYSVEFRLFGEVGESCNRMSENLLCVGASGPFHNIFFKKTIKRIKIVIGPLLLSSGNYSISLSVMAGNIRADTWDKACSFQIIDCQPTALGCEITSAGCILNHSFSVLE